MVNQMPFDVHPTPGRIVQVLVLGTVVVVTALGNFFLTASYIHDGFGREFLLVAAIVSQWSLLAVICALTGRTPFGGALLSTALSPFTLGAAALGAAYGGSLTTEDWVPLALIPGLLPVTAIPLLGARFLFGWRLADRPASQTKTFKLADLFSLMVVVAYDVVLFRFAYSHIGADCWRVLVEMRSISGAVTGGQLMFVLPALAWLAYVQDRRRSTHVFLFAMAIVPAMLVWLVNWFNPRGFSHPARDVGFLAAPLVLFGYLFGCIWLLWIVGFRLETRRNRGTTSPDESRQTAWGWQSLATAWLIVLAVVFGVWGTQVDRQKRLVAALPEFLERVDAIQGSSGGKPVIAFRDDSVTDRDLRFLTAATDLYGLNLSQNPITDRGLRHLRSLPDLKSLGLAGTQVSDRGMVELAEFENLQILDLAGTRVTAEGLSQFRIPDRFTTLGLHDCPVADPACAVLSRFRNLTTLELSQTDITDVGLSKLTGLSELVSLGLQSTAITDAGLSEATEFSKLKSLDVRDTSVDGTGLASWGENPEMMFLFADDSDFGDAGLEAVLQFTGLNMLSINRTEVSDDGLATLGRHASLCQLNLNETHVTGEGLRRLFAMPELMRLSLNDTPVGDDAFRDWPPTAPMVSLSLAGTQVTDEVCRHLASAEGLEYVHLDRTAITDGGIRQFSDSSVRLLGLSHTAVTARGLMDAGIQSLSMISVAEGQFTQEELDGLKAAGISVISSEDVTSP